MKKITLIAFACAMLLAPSVVSAQEVTYVEDPAQGYLFNSMKDNWFIQGEGGVGVMMSKWDAKADFGHRLGAKANLFIGKWFSPLLGVRLGGEYNQMKGLTANKNAIGYREWPVREYNRSNKLANQEFNNFGIAGDVMFNLTNWLCGYKPGRFYNGVLYAGAAMHWVVEREGHNGDWKYAGGHGPSRNLSLRAGLLNSFALTKRIDLLLDLRFDLMQEHVDGAGTGTKTWIEYPGVLLGASYKFGKTEWNAPVTAVCPTYKYTDAEGDALVARLAAANAKIADLEAQLRKCLEGNKPAPGPKPVVTADHLATIYYPINRTEILGVQKDVLNAVADVMAADQNADQTYKLTGWADTYTGKTEGNVKLRKGRVEGVYNALVKKGIAENRLEKVISDDKNREEVDFGPKSAPLSRAVTIDINK